MRKSLIILLTLLSIFLAHGKSSAAQADGASVLLLNREGQAVTEITDGDTVQMQVRRPQPAQALENITFSLDGSTTVLGGCTVPAGKTECKTDPLLTLGWYWGAQGNAQAIRTITAWPRIRRGVPCKRSPDR